MEILYAELDIRYAPNDMVKRIIGNNIKLDNLLHCLDCVFVVFDEDYEDKS